MSDCDVEQEPFRRSGAFRIPTMMLNESERWLVGNGHRAVAERAFEYPLILWIDSFLAVALCEDRSEILFG